MTYMSYRKACRLFLHLSLLACSIMFLSFPASASEGRQKASSLLKEAVVLYESGNYDRAAELLAEAVKSDANYPEVHDQLGYVLLKKKNYDGALDSFNAALKINPRFRTSRTGIGLVLYAKGDLKGAEETLKEALTLNPYPAMTHYALGLVYEKLGAYEKAIHHFKEGIRTFKGGKR
ncbi:MAG: tetratricopeptide repeat protein [Nitrospirae bacterium]|nr:MAG: tetratricopeptide repeat protein [Nitrospirota bacterium]